MEQWVKVIVQDLEGQNLIEFEANNRETFVEMAEKVGFEIPSSCRSGACFVCAAKILQWQDAIDIGKAWVPLVDVEYDQCLTCIAGVKNEMFGDGKYHKIVLQKLM